MKKEKDTVNIRESWEDMLPTYAQIFQNLNQEGQKQCLEQLNSCHLQTRFSLFWKSCNCPQTYVVAIYHP